MKKLMIAAAIVCAAAFAHAGAVSWKNTYAINQIDQPGDYGATFAGTVYLIQGDGSSFTDAALLNTWAEALANATVISSATLNGNAFQTLLTPSGATLANNIVSVPGYSGDVTAFMTAIDGDGNFYISEYITKNVPGSGSNDFYFTHDASYNGVKFNDATSYQGAGWYTAVPEPTSGLLLLLGVAGLALRRRRA